MNLVILQNDQAVTTSLAVALGSDIGTTSDLQGFWTSIV